MANCPINEQTGDGHVVGQCCFHLKDGKTCPRHGDVSEPVRVFDQEGRLTRENEHRKRQGLAPLGA